MKKYKVYNYKGELVIQNKLKLDQKEEDKFDWRKCLNKDFLMKNYAPVSLCALAACDSADLLYH